MDNNNHSVFELYYHLVLVDISNRLKEIFEYIQLNYKNGTMIKTTFISYSKLIQILKFQNLLMLTKAQVVELLKKNFLKDVGDEIISDDRYKLVKDAAENVLEKNVEAFKALGSDIQTPEIYEKVIKIDGWVCSYKGHDKWLDDFLIWLESRGEYFGGVTGEEDE